MKDFYETMYAALFKMSTKKRNRILFEIFGWDGKDALRFIEESRHLQ